MSPTGAVVAARLATARETGDLSALAADDAAADAMTLLREATPVPGADVDATALADVCWTCYLAGQAGGENASVAAPISDGVGGFLMLRAGETAATLPGQLRDRLALVPGSVREAQFASVVAAAHAAPVRPDSAGAGMTASDLALEWSAVASRSARQAARGAGDGGHAGSSAGLATRTLGRVLTQRIVLLTARFDQVGEPGALAEAAREGRAVAERLTAADPAHAPYLAIAIGAMARAALLLGDPSPEEAERFAALAPPGPMAEAAAGMLGALRAIYGESAGKRNEADARAGIALLAGWSRLRQVGLIAAATRRLLAASEHTPPEHQAYRDALLDTALVTAFLELDARRSAAGGRDFGAGVTDGWLTAFAAGCERLPDADPDRRVYMAALAAATGARAEAVRDTQPERAARLLEQADELIRAMALPPRCLGLTMLREGSFGAALTIVAFMIPWDWAALTFPGLAAPEAPQSEPSQMLARVFGEMADAMGGPEGKAVAEDMFFLDPDAIGDEQRAALAGRTRLLLGQVPDHRADLRDVITRPPGLVPAQPAREPYVAVGPGPGDPETAEPALEPPGQADPRPGRSASAEPAALRPEGSRAARLTPLFSALDELRAAYDTLLAEDDATQLDRLREITGRIAELARQLGPAAEQLWAPILDSVLVTAKLAVDKTEAIHQGRVSEVDDAAIAWFRQRLAGLPAGHPMRFSLEASLAALLRGKAARTWDTGLATGGRRRRPGTPPSAQPTSGPTMSMTRLRGQGAAQRRSRRCCAIPRSRPGCGSTGAWPPPTGLWPPSTSSAASCTRSSPRNRSISSLAGMPTAGRPSTGPPNMAPTSRRPTCAGCSACCTGNTTSGP